MSTLNFKYDEDGDVLTIEGVHYAGDLFREFGIKETHPARLMKIVNINGVLSLKVAHDSALSQRFEESLKNLGSVIHRA